MARRRTTSTEVTVSKTKEEIIKEALRIEESSRLTAKGHYNDCSLWGFCHLILGLPTTILSAVVAIDSFSQFDSSHQIAGIVALIVAGLSAVITFLNPNQKSDLHHKAGSSYDSLDNRVRIFRTIDCWGKDSDFVLTNKLKVFSDEHNKLNKENPQPSFIGYAWANWGIKRGQAKFAVDSENK